MATVQALRKEPPRSPERQQLAEAIAKRDAAEHHLAKVTAALEKAEASSIEAHRAAERARVTVEEAMASERHNLVAVALGDPDAGASLDDSKAALARAEAGYAAAKKIADALQAEHRAAEDKLKWATHELNDAVAAALRTSPEVAQLLNDLEVAKRATASIVQKLAALMNAGAIKEINWSLEKLRPHENPDATWAVAISRLRADPDAALPQS